MTRNLSILYCIQSILLVCLSQVLYTTEVYGQEIKNAVSTLEEGKVHVMYDLISDKEDFTYNVNLFCSSNSFLSPLTKVTGDVGTKVQPGSNKMIVWDAESELVKFRGEVTIRVEVIVVAPFVSFRSPTAGDKLKRGKTHSIKWAGGPASSNLKIELVQGDRIIHNYGSVQNKESYSVEIPSNVKPGTYQVKVSGGNNEAISKEFSIKRKVSWGVKLLPLIVVGGAAAVVVGGMESGETPGETKGIPNPPDLD